MKLFYTPGACSLAAHIALMETGLKFSTEQVNLRTKQYSGGDFTKINSKGSVPALELDNGHILSECAVILQYIADQKPEAGLIPKQGTFERYRSQEWLNYIASEVHKGFSPLWNPSASAETKTLAKENLARRFEWLSNQLQDNQFIMGAHFTVLDAYLFTILNWAPITDVDLSKWPVLMGFVERVRGRPAVVATMKAEGLLK